MMPSRARWIAFVALLLVCLALPTGCRRDRDTMPTPTPDTDTSGATNGTTDGGVTAADTGLRFETPAATTAPVSYLSFRLAEGAPPFLAVPTLPTVDGTPLSDAEVAAILARLPDIAAESDDSADFRLPPESLPRPAAGERVATVFPPPDAPPPPDAAPEGPLELLRFAPEGEIPIAPFVSITFNRPMVPLATDAQLQALDVPAVLSPEVPGTWRWLGTRTLRFDAAVDAIDRLPMATEYTVTVPAGTTAADGAALAADVSWTFATPRPTVQTFYPQSGPLDLEPLFFIRFDQRVNPDDVLPVLSLTADGADQPLRLATTAEVEADEAIAQYLERALPERAFVFRADTRLPADAAIDIRIGPGVPSAEGPLRSETAQRYAMRTYAPLVLMEHRCGWNECTPLTPFTLQFNNPLDWRSITAGQVTVTPDLPGATVSGYGSTLNISGPTRGNTRYTVDVTADIRDIFGQTLGEPISVTFDVGQARPLLAGLNQLLTTLDPSLPSPAVSVYSINHDTLALRAYAVTPDDWPAYLRYLDESGRDDAIDPFPASRLVLDDVVPVNSVADTLVETAIDLSAVMPETTRHLVVVVAPAADFRPSDQDRWSNQPLITWVQQTNIALDAFADSRSLRVWATALDSGAPLANLPVTLVGAGRTTVETGADGTVTAPLDDSPVSLLVAEDGDDQALLPYAESSWNRGGWQANTWHDQALWYVIDDRAIYRPGETVHLKGWIRRMDTAADGDIALFETGTIGYQVMGAQGNELAAGAVPVTALGGFDLSFTLPENANLGYANINFELRADDRLDQSRHYHGFQIQEFRRPEFEVTTRNESPGPFVVGDEAVVSVNAAYFAGGPLPNAEVLWNVSAQPSSYAPPGWSGFTFGTWTPWWGIFDDYGAADVAYEFGFPERERGPFQSYSGQTDASGNHYLALTFEALEGRRPFTLLAEGTVFDVDRQAWASTTSLLVHPGDLYVGLRGDRTFVRQGTPIEIDAIVTDIDGNAVTGVDVTVTAVRLEWQFSAGRWTREEVDPQTCASTSADTPQQCTFDTTEGGEYQITAVVTDRDGRANESRLTRWVSGGNRRPQRSIEQEQVLLVPDKETYAPGDVAEILLQAPFDDASGLLTVSRGDVLYTERFDIDGAAHVLRIPIEDAHIPNLRLQVDLAGVTVRSADDGTPQTGLPPRPAYATGSLDLSIPPRSRTLDVSVTPERASLTPGGSTTLQIAVTDADGRPAAGAEVAVIAVDEAILALTNYQLADPLSAFYPSRYGWLDSRYARGWVELANPAGLVGEGGDDMAVQATRAAAPAEVMEEAEYAAADTADAGSDGAGPPIALRTDFNPLALFAPVVRTDGSGRAEIQLDLPDTLTRYRIMVVAAAGAREFGSAEAAVAARLPLNIRAAAPRFLNFGDTIELPVVVQNQTDRALTVDVVVRASQLTLAGGAGQRVTIPANDRVEVRFPASTVSAGTARLQVAAVAGDFADAAEISLPVYTPATTEAFATYGVLDGGTVVQPLLPPADVYAQFGGLEIGTSSTAVQALTDAIIYLNEYDYGSSEALASRILAIAALRDVLEAFAAEGLPPATELDARVEQDVARLLGMQNGDGGFPAWQRGRESVPFHSIHVTYALLTASAEGYAVDRGALSNALNYLETIETRWPDYYSVDARRSLTAYALFVRLQAGDSDAVAAARLVDSAGLDELSLEAVGWLWHVFDAAPGYADYSADILRHVNNRVVETPAGATFVTDYGEDAYLILGSRRRADAVLLEALVAAAPESDLIPKVVNSLLAQRTRGHWGTTQENVFVLTALNRYFNTFEAVTPAFVARVWLGDTYAAEHAYAGRTVTQNQTAVPMSFLLDALTGGSTEDIVIQQDGSGRLYYRLGLSYAPTDLQLEPIDRGFIVLRTYEAVDDPDDVQQAEDGTWRIRAGARVRVRLTLVAESRRTHVALIDPLPAGLEIVNPALAVSADVPPDPADSARGYWWWWTWYDHQNMRDDRAEAFATYLWAGDYTYTYVTRATTPGTYVVPPARAEEMYAPEVFGRSATETVIVAP